MLARISPEMLRATGGVRRAGTPEGEMVAEESSSASRRGPTSLLVRSGAGTLEILEVRGESARAGILPQKYQGVDKQAKWPAVKFFNFTRYGLYYPSMNYNKYQGGPKSAKDQEESVQAFLRLDGSRRKPD
ncbi:hypothetical protein C8R44DRAFT_740042 [Mycena epipterygia]|nr:hypothetical protein C8R44DRAFT_740042 [Mycena epipterygia]